jgi:hypothetical protein
MNRSITMALRVAACAVTLGAAGAAQAKPKAATPARGDAPSACGFHTLPLAVGNTWTYKSGGSQVNIKITAVGPGKDWQGHPATAIDTEETYGGKTTKITWTCTPGFGLSIPLDSFFWSGEPGATVGATFTVTSHDKPWLVPEEQFTGDVSWIEDVKADVTRADSSGAGAQHAPSKIQVERHAQLKGQEKVMIALGQFNADKVVFELRGRGFIGDEKAEIPIKRPATFYFVKGVGLVKILDAFDKSWELAESNLVAK